MVWNCAVNGCNSYGYKNSGRSFYRIPAIIQNQGDHVKEISANRRQRWIANLARKDMAVTKSTRICDLHFVGGKPASLMEVNHPAWAPTLDMGHKLLPRVNPEKALERYTRFKKRLSQKNNLLRDTSVVTSPVSPVLQTKPSAATIESERAVIVQAPTASFLLLCPGGSNTITLPQSEACVFGHVNGTVKVEPTDRQEFAHSSRDPLLLPAEAPNFLSHGDAAHLEFADVRVKTELVDEDDNHSSDDDTDSLPPSMLLCEAQLHTEQDFHYGAGHIDSNVILPNNFVDRAVQTDLTSRDIGSLMLEVRRLRDLIKVS